MILTTVAVGAAWILYDVIFYKIVHSDPSPKETIDSGVILKELVVESDPKQSDKST